LTHRYYTLQVCLYATGKGEQKSSKCRNRPVLTSVMYTR